LPTRFSGKALSGVARFTVWMYSRPFFKLAGSPHVLRLLS
jgi:hypothetical protein